MYCKIGYKPVKRHRITGESVLNKIKYNKLRYVGVGASGAVFTDGKYAIKVGYVYESDYEFLSMAAEKGFAVPVLFLVTSTKIDSRIIDILNNTPDVSERGFINNDGTAGLMVSMLATPYLDQSCEISNEERSKAYDIAYEVQEAAQSAGIHWSDVHPWNLAIYRNALVIIDG